MRTGKMAAHPLSVHRPASDKGTARLLPTRCCGWGERPAPKSCCIPWGCQCPFRWTTRPTTPRLRKSIWTRLRWMAPSNEVFSASAVRAARTDGYGDHRGRLSFLRHHEHRKSGGDPRSGSSGPNRRPSPAILPKAAFITWLSGITPGSMSSSSGLPNCRISSRCRRPSLTARFFPR